MEPKSTQRLKELFRQQTSNEGSNAGYAELLAYFDDPLYAPVIDELMAEAFRNTDGRFRLPDAKREQVLQQILETPVVPLRNPIIKRLWYKVAVAAAVVAMIAGAGMYLYRQDHKTGAALTAKTNDVAPGKQGATLTLAGGRKIRLADAADGELASEAGVRISKNSKGQLVYEIQQTSSDADRVNTLSTVKGETYQLRLPDGSMVWLNSASSLTYPAALLKDGKRRVTLQGEGYFSVAKDKAHPFVVEARGQQVEVLGTEFNINSYADEPAIRTTLLEGSVKVGTAAAHRVLKPGEQSRAGADGGLSVQEIDTELAVAWKNNQFIFDNDNIEYIMRMLSRWYNVEVVYQGSVPTKKFGGAVSRFDHISSVLKILEMTGGAQFKIEGRTVYVSK